MSPVTPNPDAEFSTLAMTKSIARCSTRAGIARRAISRPGFPKALYELTYDAPGAPDVAVRAAELLRGAGYEPRLDAERGRDHGAWVPAMLAWPAGDGRDDRAAAR